MKTLNITQQECSTHKAPCNEGKLSNRFKPGSFRFILTWLIIALTTTFSMAQYNIGGNTTSLGGGCYRLTTENTFQAGSVWLQSKITLQSDLTVEATINLGDIDGSGADGIAFVLQPLCTGLGGAGGGIGYEGITPSLDVEFDTWENGNFADPSDDHIALMKNGDLNHSGSNNLQGPFSLSNLEDGNDHTLKVEWIASTMTLKVTLDGVLRINYTNDIVANIFGNDPNVFWGFTAATGSAINDQTVCISSANYIENGSYTVTDANCPNFNDGAIDLDDPSGTGPFTYQWSNNETTQDIDGLTPGTYTVTVTDGNSCHSSFEIEVKRAIDNLKPKMQCVTNQTKTGSSYTVSGTEFDAFAVDNCGSVTLINDYNNSSTLAGAVFNVGTTLVTWTATDGSNNSSTCQFTVTVQNPTNNCGAGTPVGANVVTGNKTLSTQTDVNNFFSTISGVNNGNKWTKVVGNLTLDGSSGTDPISDLCNLRALTEVTGQLLINNFNRSGNPTNLADLGALTRVGGKLFVNSNPQLIEIELVALQLVGASIVISNNDNAKSIDLPVLNTVNGDQMAIKNNARVEKMFASENASSLTLGVVAVNISDNGASAANPLTINMKKITVVKGTLLFVNNDNTGVSNFDDIFSGLTNVSLPKGNLSIVNNDYLAKCCIAASAVVAGTRTISGNTGNCATIPAVIADCGALHKINKSVGGLQIDEMSFNVYPSPNKGTFAVDLVTSETGNLKISVTDLMGRVVFNQQQEVNGSSNIPVNMEFAPQGQYILKAEMNGQVFVRRVIILN